jgi:hypothetical protein
MSSNQSPNANTWDLSPPRRPGLADFNGAAKADDANFTPDPTTMPSAAEYNTMQLLLVALSQMIPSAEVSILASASPSIIAVLSPVSAVNGNPGAFVMTRSAAGNYTIEPTVANMLPAQVGAPRAYLNGIGNSSATIAAAYTTGPVHGYPAVQVEIFQGGVLTDIPFTVMFR